MPGYEVGVDGFSCVGMSLKIECDKQLFFIYQSAVLIHKATPPFILHAKVHEPYKYCKPQILNLCTFFQSLDRLCL